MEKISHLRPIHKITFNKTSPFTKFLLKKRPPHGILFHIGKLNQFFLFCLYLKFIILKLKRNRPKGTFYLQGDLIKNNKCIFEFE